MCGLLSPEGLAEFSGLLGTDVTSLGCKLGESKRLNPPLELEHMGIGNFLLALCLVDLLRSLLDRR